MTEQCKSGAQPQVLYFGCWESTGHFLHMENGRCPEGIKHHSFAGGRSLDGGFCPGRRDSFGHVADKNQAEGAAALDVVDGPGGKWTILAFWDRSVDRRHNSNSTFVIKGIHDIQTAASLARERFPRIWARFPFTVFDAATGQRIGCAQAREDE